MGKSSALCTITYSEYSNILNTELLQDFFIHHCWFYAKWRVNMFNLPLKSEIKQKFPSFASTWTIILFHVSFQQAQPFTQSAECLVVSLKLTWNILGVCRCKVDLLNSLKVCETFYTSQTSKHHCSSQICFTAKEILYLCCAKYIFPSIMHL